MTRRWLLSLFVPCLAWLMSLNGSAAMAQEGLADVVERCEQSVVKIAVEGKRGNSLGSGFIIDPSGTLVTNVHVLAGAQKAVATFPNGTTCEIKGTFTYDQSRDICIAKIDGTAFPVLVVATRAPRKGERVTALGSPQGLSFSASSGIVSAIRPAEELGPEIGRPELQGTWIQVDAALSPGNSGGPLINDKGEVVGISTMASLGGTAQNLNFGISGGEILKLHETAKSSPLVPLPDGIGKLETEEHSSSGGGSSGLPKPPLPKAALDAYISEGRDTFADLQRGVRQELSRLTTELKEMRKGQSILPPNSPNVDVVKVFVPRTKKNNYFFRSQGVKDREISRVQTRLRALQGVEKAAKENPSHKETLYKLLSNSGPRLDTRREGSIGFMVEAMVLVAFDDHGVIVIYDDAPYLLWVDSAAGLFTGSEMPPTPVLVAGTHTVEIPGEGSRVVTLLRAVTDGELKNAILGNEPAGAAPNQQPKPEENTSASNNSDSSDAGSSSSGSSSSGTSSKGYRIWRDDTGKFEIEAQLISVNNKEVMLKKKDGSTVKVPLSRLSSADRKAIGK